MEHPARYCEYCGKPLDEKARFCGRCGKPVDLGKGEQINPLPRPAQPPPATLPPSQGQAPNPAVRQPPAPRPSQPLPAPQPPAAPPEVVCGVIPGAYQKKGFSQQNFILVLTNYRIIFAIQTNQMMQEQARRAKEEARQEGKGFFGQLGAQELTNFGKHYLQARPQAILAEQPGNFFILNNQLRSVKFRVIPGGEDSQDEYRLDFDAVTGKVSVMFSMIDQKKVKQALTQVLGERVHWGLGLF